MGGNKPFYNTIKDKRDKEEVLIKIKDNMEIYFRMVTISYYVTILKTAAYRRY